MRRLALMIALSLTASAAADPQADAAKARKALQELGEFVGQWNLDAESKSAGKIARWKETVAIAWKFQGDDAWLTIDIKKDSMPATGELRYSPAKKQYVLELSVREKPESNEGRKQTFTGEWKKGKLTFTGTNEASGDVTRIVMNTLADGIRLSVVTELQTGGSGPFETLAKAVGNKEGEALAGNRGAAKPECIVTGGTASMTVTYMGKTYYVCCSGCRDEFNANPQKYIDAAAKSKK